MKYIIVILSLVLAASGISAQAIQQQTDSVRSGWQRVALPDGQTASVASMSFISRDTGWIAAAYGAFITYDGCLSWIPMITSLPFEYVHFFDANEGWLIEQALSSPRLFHTMDGGHHWDTTVFPFSGNIDLVYWKNRDSAFIVAGGITRTTDHGKSWVAIANTDTATLHCMAFWDSKHGIALGGNYYISSGPNAGSSNGAGILRTDDGGATWYRPPHLSFLANFKSLEILDSTSVLAFFSNYRTTNLGISWAPQQGVPPAWCSSFLSAKQGIVGCGLGLIAMTIDSTKTWRYQPTNTLEDIYAIQFLDSVNAIALATGGLILKTNTGGFADVQQPPSSNLTVNTYPNPAQQNITFQYSLPSVVHVTLTIYSPDGVMVAQPLLNDLEMTGTRVFVFSTDSLASGTYLYTLSSEGGSFSSQFTIIH